LQDAETGERIQKCTRSRPLLPCRCENYGPFLHASVYQYRHLFELPETNEDRSCFRRGTT
jgi:hypothetical protein